MHSFKLVVFLASIGIVSCEPWAARLYGQDVHKKLSSAVTFYASFDTGPSADFARGDAQIYSLSEGDAPSNAKPELPRDGKTVLAPGEGLQGAALKFTKRDAIRVFFQASNNLRYEPKDWQGSVSCWLRLDPETDLEPGYCDPLQITPRSWNDAAFFVDFDQAGDPRDFRLGAFADLAIWNPKGEELPESERPLLPVKNPPFGRDKWTHVVFTWTGFNRGDQSAEATLYLDGKSQGTLSGWNQQFTWGTAEQPLIYVGLNYIGLFDELICFDRALSSAEVAELYRLRGEFKAHALPRK